MTLADKVDVLADQSGRGWGNLDCASLVRGDERKISERENPKKRSRAGAHIRRSEEDSAKAMVGEADCRAHGRHP